MYRHLTAILLVLVFAAPAVSGEIKLKTDTDKTIYTLGNSISAQLRTFNLTDSELEILLAGVRDGVSGADAQVDVSQYRENIRQLSLDRLAAGASVEREAGATYAAKAAKERGAMKTDSGLVFKELEPGDGATPVDGNRVKVHYRGSLRDGNEFDSSYTKGVPATFGVNGVIPCWTEALKMMQVGAKAKIVCPSDIAYGDRGKPGRIPPGATLIFEVELLDIVQ